jgi:anaerobic selenocysteine-containing dehydrogenase
MRMHPEDAAELGVEDGERVICQSSRDEIEVIVEVDDSVRRGVLTLPHGYGMSYQGSDPLGPAVNRLTSSDHCDPFTKTPYHKYVPVKVRKHAPRSGSARTPGESPMEGGMPPTVG